MSYSISSKMRALVVGTDRMMKFLMTKMKMKNLQYLLSIPLCQEKLLKLHFHRNLAVKSLLTVKSVMLSSEVDAQKTPDQSPAQQKARLFRLANELLMTERSYVAALYLIDQVLHFRVDQENRAHPIFPQI